MSAPPDDDARAVAAQASGTSGKAENAKNSTNSKAARTALERHPLSAAFPDMSGSEFAELVEDIKANGQRDPGSIFEGMILEGWHRYLACERAGVPFASSEFDGDDPVAFVLSKNLHRRHLTATQRAECVVACTNWRANGVRYSSASGAELTAAEMAKKAEVSPRTIEQAKKAHAAGLGDAMRGGTVSAKRAAAVADLPPAKREKALTEKPAKPPKEETVPVSQYEALQKKHTTLSEKYDELVAELETVETVRNGEQAKAMGILKQSLAQANRARDDAMREAVQMRKQIERLTRELKRLGWKGFKK